MIGMPRDRIMLHRPGVGGIQGRGDLPAAAKPGGKRAKRDIGKYLVKNLAKILIIKVII
jgi:hypothetical protein